MCTTLTICNGAFKAELVKGENGKGDTWKYTPNWRKLGKKKKKEGSVKEKPQYAFVAVAEKETVSSYQKVIKSTVIDIVKFLKTVK